MPPWGRRLLAWLGFAAPLYGIYLLLVDQAPLPELVAGLVAAGLASLATVLSGLAGRVSLSVEPRWLLRMLPAPWWMARDSVLVALSALRRQPPRGRFRTLASPSAGGDSPRDVGRRVVVKAAGSAGPNMYVLGGDPDTKLLLVHELLPRGDRTTIDVVERAG
ncbi:MAG: hypothetical protein JWN32_2577 [Solirubrobacterales bacterium]|jgi:hypothetical protein|nr:hypothetical protein [Solirubrobacterales bacterium]